MMNNENSKQIEINNNTRRQRKRSVFDFEQIRQLEHVFDQITHYPDLPLRQHLTLITKLPDKKIQIWFQNRRAKWRKQHQLVNFGGLHELEVDGHHSFVPTPKPNFVLTSPSLTMPNNTSMKQLEYYFYWAFQATVAKANYYPEQAFLMKKDNSSFSSPLNHY